MPPFVHTPTACGTGDRLAQPWKISGIQCWPLHVLREIAVSEDTLPETNSSHLKIPGWKMEFPFQMVLFRGHVNFRGIPSSTVYLTNVFC